MTESVPKKTSPPWWRRGRPLLLLLLLAAVCLGGLGLGWRLWRDQQRKQALALARDGHFPQALSALEDVLAGSPDDVEATEALARGYLGQDDRQAAEPFLERWGRLRPDDPEPFRLTVEAFRKERPDKALPAALHLVELAPEDADVVLRAAGLCFSTGDFEQAERLCRRALSPQPGRRDARRLLAQVLRARGQFTAAGDLLDALLRERPDDPAAMMGRGALYVELHQPEPAIPLLETVVKVDPTRQRPARYQLALAYEQAGRTEDARRVQAELHHLQEAEVLRDALNSQPDNPDVQVRAARAWLADGETAAALDLLGRVLERNPDHAGAHLALADYYDGIGDSARAADSRRRAGVKP